MRQAVSLLCALSLLGCGEGLPQAEAQAAGAVEQSIGCVDCERSPDSADAPGTHGYEIVLPVGDQALLPAAWRWEDRTEVGSFVWLRSGASDGTMDWGGGSALYHVGSPSRPPLIRTHVAPGTGYAVLGHISGYFSNIQAGLVRGSVELAPEQDSQPVPTSSDFVELALQAHNGALWQDVATRRVYTSGWGLVFAELQATVQPNQPVRFEIRGWRDSTWHRFVYITKARMFGAQCYVDFSNPTGCL
ncbi:hypothetical protein ACLESD_20280 [Pyxidicoccus sp. 3LFB2]